MAGIHREIGSLQAGQRRLFAQLDQVQAQLDAITGDVREALAVRDRAIARLSQQLRAIHVELELAVLRRKGKLPPAPKRDLELV